MTWREAEASYTDEMTGRTTLPQMFVDAVELYSDAPAQQYKGGIYNRSLTPDILPAPAHDDWQTLTYRELGDIVRVMAAGFRDIGVSAGDRIGIFADTRLEWAQSDLAILSLGAVVTTVYPTSSPRQVRYLLNDAGATGIILENAELLSRVREVETDLDLEFIVCIDELPDTEQDKLDTYSLAEIYDRGRTDEGGESVTSSIEAIDPTDLASLIYTSGTTGRPKGVELTHWNFKANIDQCRKRFGPRPDKDSALPRIDRNSRTVSFLPLAHVLERLAGHFLMLASGATIAYAESPDTLREDFAAIQPTVGTSVPRVYEKIYQAIQEQASQSSIKSYIFDWASTVGRTYTERDDPGLWLTAKQKLADRLVFSTVRETLGGEIDFLISGGGSLSAELATLYHGMGLPVLEGYGLTETAPVISVNPPEAPDIGTIGPPLESIEIKLDSSDISENAFDNVEGDIGELLVKGPNVAEGYWQLPEETDRSFTADGWFRTGDIVEQRPNGYLRFLERRKEILVLSTGKNVAPGPIEDAFAASNVVEQCMVIGDNEKFIGALIVPAFESLHTWAEQSDIELPDSPEAICEDDRVFDRIETEVDRINDQFEYEERIKEFRVVPEEFTEENDLMTPTMKKKRRNILDYYSAEVDSIYSEH